MNESVVCYKHLCICLVSDINLILLLKRLKIQTPILIQVLKELYFTVGKLSCSCGHTEGDTATARWLPTVIVARIVKYFLYLVCHLEHRNMSACPMLCHYCSFCVYLHRGILWVTGT